MSCFIRTGNSVVGLITTKRSVGLNDELIKSLLGKLICGTQEKSIVRC